MDVASNTILITGGGSGIGLALAKRFAAAGSRVVICGRNPEKLRQAQNEIPNLHVKQCDIAEAAERKNLAAWLTKEFPQLNVLINNAGIQHRFDMPDSKEAWETHRSEIAINLEAPVHLSLLLMRHLAKQKNPAIINVSSGLAFTPLAIAPIYSATKAALHSFTLSLRAQLTRTPVKVVEIIPPAVNTDLGGPGLHAHAAPLDDFADAVFADLQAGKLEIGYGTSLQRMRASRDELDVYFEQLNKRAV